MTKPVNAVTRTRGCSALTTCWYRCGMGLTLLQAAVAAVAGWGKGWKDWPLRHMLCSMTASLRATATMARFLPRLAPLEASFKPQRRSAKWGPKRARMYCADCTSRLRR